MAYSNPSWQIWHMNRSVRTTRCHDLADVLNGSKLKVGVLVVGRGIVTGRGVVSGSLIG